MSITIALPAHSQKNAGTAVPNMGKTYTASAKVKKGEQKYSPEEKLKTAPGTYYSSSKTATVTTDTGKTYTITMGPDIDGSYVTQGYVAYATPLKDSLFVQNDTMGKLIKQIWDEDKKYTGKKPTIVMVPNLAKVVLAHKPKQQTTVASDKKLKN